MNNNFFTTILDGNISNALSKYQITAAIGNTTLKGTLRELFVQDLLEKILPSHYGVGSGIVTDKWNRQTPQCDVVIYDKRKIPPAILEANNGIYPIDSVHRVLEIKSVLTSSSVEQALHLAWVLSPDNNQGLKMAKDGNLDGGQTHYPLVGCFAFTSEIANIDGFANKYIATRGISPSPQVIFCAKDKGLFSRDENGIYTARSIPLNDIQLIRLFIGMFLHFIEEETESRSNYSLLEWLI